MTPLVVREAEGELDRIWAATVMATSEPWLTLGRSFDVCLRSCASPAGTLYIARTGAAPCGLAIVREQGLAGAPYLVSIAVAEAFRCHGVGMELLAFVEGLYRGRYRHLFLCVSEFNPRARAFYERQGYEQVGILRDFIVEGLNEHLMVKKL